MKHEPNSHQLSCKTVWKTIRIVFYAILFCVLLASTRESCAILRSARDAVASARSSLGVFPSREDAAAWASYRKALVAADKAHVQRLDAMLDEFLAGLREKGPGRFDAARYAIPTVRKKLSGFKMTGNLVKDVSLDKTKGGDRLERRLEKEIEVPFVHPLVRARESIFADCDVFAGRLAAEAKAYHEEIGRAQAKLPDSLRVRANDDRLRKMFERDKSVMRRYARKAVETSVAVAIEAAFARSTVAAIRELVLVLGGKTVAKGGLTIALPFVDGPIPVGDLLAVGGAAWTAWDVHKLARVLPDAIEKQLRATVDQTQRDTLAEAARFAREAHDAYVAAAAGQ